jgi:3-isopropylmalate dehydrogenase
MLQLSLQSRFVVCPHRCPQTPRLIRHKQHLPKRRPNPIHPQSQYLLHAPPSASSVVGTASAAVRRSSTKDCHHKLWTSRWRGYVFLSLPLSPPYSLPLRFPSITCATLLSTFRSAEALLLPNIPLRKGGPNARIAVIPGDGIGKEVTPVAVNVIRAATAKRHHHIDFVEFDWGADKYLREEISLPEGAVDMLCDEFDAILFGALGDPRVPSNQHAADILLGLRFKLDLYVNARPAELFHERFCPLKDRIPNDIRMMVFRENTEGVYIGSGGFFKKGTIDEIATQEDINTRKGVERILRFAFEYARGSGIGRCRGRTSGQTQGESTNVVVPPHPAAHKPFRLCMSDKSNAMTFAGDLWQRTFQLVRAEYPDVDSRHLYIDTLAMELIRDPRQFDVIVTNNLFGDIISDLTSQLAGGLGLAPSGNIHPGGTSLFEPVHGSAPNIAGKGIANPFGSVLASGMMLEYLGWSAEAELLKQSVKSALYENITTPDLHGSKQTLEVADWLTNFVSRHS